MKVMYSQVVPNCSSWSVEQKLISITLDGKYKLCGSDTSLCVPGRDASEIELKINHDLTLPQMSYNFYCLQIGITTPQRGKIMRLSLYQDLSLQISHPVQESPFETLFEQWCGFFYVPQEPYKWNWCEIRPTVFHPFPRRLKKSNHLQMSLQRHQDSTFSQLFKTLIVGPAGVWTRDLTSQRTSTFPTEPPRQQCCIWKLGFRPSRSLLYMKAMVGL